jgi:hypothetical protein
MSLPAGQQRVLDAIGEALRATEPRLASMFAIFTRLSKDEPPPRREQLTAPGAIALLATAWRRPPRRGVLAGDSLRARRTTRMMLLISQLAIAFIVLAALLGVSARAPARCAAPRTSAAVAALHLACGAPTGGISAGGISAGGK